MIGLLNYPILMKLLLDQGLPRTASKLLCETGMDSVHVGDIGKFAASDHEILELARLENRVVVTLDADFHLLLALSEANGPSVIRFRIEGLRAEPLVKIILQVVAEANEELLSGAVVTVQQTRIRIRHLPFLKGKLE